MTRIQMRKLVILICVCIIVLTLFVGVWFWMGGQTKSPFALSENSTNGQTFSYVLQQGLEREEDIQIRNLPIYTFTPGAEWKQTENGAEQMNQFSKRCKDVYQMGSVTTLTFTQEFAVKGTTIPSGQEVKFGDLQVIFSQTQQSEDGSIYQTKVYWVYENSLLSLACDYGPKMHLNEILNLMRLVDYNTLRKPIYSQLSLSRGYVTVENFHGIAISQQQNICSIGNPQIPENASFARLNKLPNGFIEMSSYSSSSSEQTVKYITQGFVNSTNNREQIIFHCWLGSNEKDTNGLPSGFSMLSNQEAELVQETTVNGNPAFFYIDEEGSYIGWIDGYYTLELDLLYPVTQEELIALAESVE